MAAIGTKLRRAVGGGRVMLMHWCPGCDDPHGIIIEGGPPIWSFDGNYDAPTFSPSILCFTTETTDDDDKPLPAPVRRTLCHYFIKAGKIEFCGDSPHKLAGQIVDLPDWPYAPGTYGGIEE
ncbi:DUF6527 family protein [Bradyrhizobium sp. LjRoot220]|uniref:DUF6527 family protein n=1 Tax=Bradyrhizobium sp. LjRoot220 TaxID=3342284 RepID=UPI003ED083C7